MVPPDIVVDVDGAGGAVLPRDDAGVDAGVPVLDALGDAGAELLAVGLGGDDGDDDGHEGEDEHEEEDLGGGALAEGLADGVAGGGDDDLHDGAGGEDDDEEEVEGERGDEDAPEEVAVGVRAEAAEGEAGEVAAAGLLGGVPEEDEGLEEGPDEGERDDNVLSVLGALVLDAEEGDVPEDDEGEVGPDGGGEHGAEEEAEGGELAPAAGVGLELVDAVAEEVVDADEGAADLAEVDEPEAEGGVQDDALRVAAQGLEDQVGDDGDVDGHEGDPAQHGDGHELVVKVGVAVHGQRELDVAGHRAGQQRGVVDVLGADVGGAVAAEVGGRGVEGGGHDAGEEAHEGVERGGGVAGLPGLGVGGAAVQGGDGLGGEEVGAGHVDLVAHLAADRVGDGGGRADAGGRHGAGLEGGGADQGEVGGGALVGHEVDKLEGGDEDAGGVLDRSKELGVQVLLGDAVCVDGPNLAPVAHHEIGTAGGLAIESFTFAIGK